MINDLLYHTNDLLNNNKQTVEINGKNTLFWTRNKTEFSRIKNLGGEKDIIDKLISDIREDDIFWDVGANIGMYSLLAAKEIHSGSVISFEPDYRNFTRICQNVALNDQWDTIRPANTGLSNQNRKTILEIAQEDVGAGGHTTKLDDRKNTDFDKVDHKSIQVRKGELLDR